MTKTVIVAVHDPNILYLLQRYAEESGFQTVCAARDRDVLALLDGQENPALIILDAELPGAAGNKTWCKIKTEAELQHIPVVVYSCLDEPSEAWHGDVVDCLPKSVMYDDFVAALKRAGVFLGPAFA